MNRRSIFCHTAILYLTLGFLVPASGFATASPQADPDNVYWDDQFAISGTYTLYAGDDIYAMAADGKGNIYVGGECPLFGDLLTQNIARWDGSRWHPLGSGLRGRVKAIAVNGDEVYAGGRFVLEGDTSYTYIAKWDGSKWSRLGSGVSNWVTAIAVSGNDLYVGGPLYFEVDGEPCCRKILRWNGSSWCTLGGLRIDKLGCVYALAVKDTDLYVAGHFDTAGGLETINIAKWDGSNWSQLGTGLGTHTEGRVNTLLVSGNKIYAGGSFVTAGDTIVNCVAAWDGTVWSPLGSGVQREDGPGPEVHCLGTDGTDIYVGGSFRSASGIPAGGIAKWDGSSWSALGDGVFHTPTNSSWGLMALAVSEGDVYVADSFDCAGGIPASGIAKWDGTSWCALSEGFNLPVYTIKVDGDDAYLGGEFTNAPGIMAKTVAKWDGRHWESVCEDHPFPSCCYFTSAVNALVLSDSQIYVCGDGVAKLEGSSWSRVGALNKLVSALGLDSRYLYAGGSFREEPGEPHYFIARWDGTRWSGLGSGISGGQPPDTWVHCIAINDDEAYVGGNFTLAGSSTANHVAKWDGTSWSPLGSGMNAPVHALAVSGDHLYAGGEFTAAGDIPADHIARWDGSAWHAVYGGLNGPVYAIELSGNNVYVGGDFSVAGGKPARSIAKWDGSTWSAFGTGIDGSVRAIGLIGDALLAGGDFFCAGDKVSAFFARWMPRVNRDTVSLPQKWSATLGDNPHGFFKPSLTIPPGARLTYPDGLPVCVTMEMARQIRVLGRRINGAFTLSPHGIRFTDTKPTLRIEFSEDDVAMFDALCGAEYTDFRAVKILYRSDYPGKKEAAALQILSDEVPVPIRVQNGTQIYAITIPISEIGSTYGAVPLTIETVSAVEPWTQYE